MIKLTLQYDGSTIYINPSHISTVHDNNADGATYVSMISDEVDDRGFRVKENMAQIVKRIREVPR